MTFSTYNTKPSLYKGVVMDNNDPKKLGRVRVNIFGVTEDIEDGNYPFAEVVQSTFMGYGGGTGISSVLRVGTTVWVMFEDNNQNHPIVIGCCSGINPQQSESVYPRRNRLGVSDYASESIAKDNLIRDSEYRKKFNYENEIKNDKYLSSHVIESPSGHLVVFDDTVGSQKIRIEHCSGRCNIEIDSYGNLNIINSGLEGIKYKVLNDMTFEVDRNMTFKVKGDVRWDIDGDITEVYNKNRYTNIKEEDRCTVQSDQITVIEGNKKLDVSKHFTQNIGKTWASKIGDKVGLLCNSDIGIDTTNGNIVAQSSVGSLQLTTNGASLGAKGSSVKIHGNEIDLESLTNVNGELQVQGNIASSMYVMGIDFANCVMPSVSTTSLTESLQSYANNEIKSINESFNELKKFKDVDETMYSSVINRINDLNYKLQEGSKKIARSFYNDYIVSNRQLLGNNGISGQEMQMLLEGSYGGLGGSYGASVGVKFKNPNGSFIEESDCQCNFFDPTSWFKINKIEFPTLEDFKNMVSFKITMPNLYGLLPKIPQFSLKAIVMMVMQICAIKIIKLLSKLKAMIMKMIRPIINAINQVMAIVSMLPPKINIDLDFENLIKKPLFNIPSIPKFTLPDFCECAKMGRPCKYCDSKKKQLLKAMDEVNGFTDKIDSTIAENIESANQGIESANQSIGSAVPNGTYTF